MREQAVLPERPSMLPWLSFILFGCVLGAMFAVSPGGIFVLFLVVISGGLIYKVVGVRDRRFVLGLFVIGFMLRALLSLSLDAGALALQGQEAMGKHGEPNVLDLGVVDNTRNYVKMGDSDFASRRGYATAQFAKGVPDFIVRLQTQHFFGWSGYLYVIGAFYSLVDFSPCAVKLLNCLFGALLGPLIFALARRCFNSSVARWANAAVIFFPSLILWSASNLKEPSLHLLTAVLLLLMVRIQRRHSIRSYIWYLLLIGCAGAAHSTLRSPIYSFALLACGFVGWLATLRIPRWWRLALIVGLILGGVGIGHRKIVPLLSHAFYIHIGNWETEGTSYQYLPDRFYKRGYLSEWENSKKIIDGELLIGMGDSLRHYLMEPFPGRLDDPLTLLTYPQMLAWYFALPFALVGVFSAIRWNLSRSLVLILMLFAWCLLGALTSGNVGTVFRMRDMVTPFLLIFACAQLQLFLYGRREFEGYRIGLDSPDPLGMKADHANR